MTDSTQLEPRDRSDRAGATPWRLPIAQIQPYERNPRHGRNPEYDRIKDSIRSHGLDQPLVITQRPQATHYIVHAGGNTRLLILNELYAETADERFAHIPCVFRPWRRESDVLLAHLRENDLRGSLTFIDKARAVFEARKLLAAECGLEDMSQRRLETELRCAGYRITQARISQMEYAVYRLLPIMPLALECGLGRPHVERIRRLERAAYAIWRERCDEPIDDFEDIFVTLCRRYDSPDWDTAVLRGALEAEITAALDVSVHTVRVMIDAELAGRELVIPEPDAASEDAMEDALEETPEETSPDTGDGVADGSDTGADHETGERVAPEVSPAGVEVLAQAGADRPDAEEARPPDRVSVDALATESPAPIAEILSVVNDTGLGDLKSLRGRAWTLAARLAQRHGLGELVAPVSAKGLGFVLRDVPDPSLADQLDDDSLSQLSMLWWQLAACAEMTFAPLAALLPLLPADSILRRALETEDAELLFNSIWTLDPGHTGYRLWRPLDDRDWRDLLGLMDTYRRIRRLAAETGASIWE